MFYPRGYRKPKCSAGLLDFSVTIRYVLPTRLQKAEMQWLIDFSVTIRYVLPTRLRRAEMQWLLDFSVTIRYVLPTRLQRAEMQWLLDFSVNSTGAPNENIVQNHLNIVVLNVF